MSAELKLAKAAELEALAAKLRAEVENENENEKVKKWWPKGGRYFIGPNSSVYEGPSFIEYSEFGAERATENQALKDAKRMRKFNRLLCWLVENGWDGELEVYAEITGEVAMIFNFSGDLGRELMRGIANGTIEL